MLKYALAFCLICYCNSAPGLVGDYKLLSLLQHSPVVSFFEPEQRDVNIDHVDFLQYVENHWETFDDESWILNSFRAFDDVGYQLDDCRTNDGLKPFFRGIMSPNDRERRKQRWPSVRLNEMDQELWKREYNTSGACVTLYENYYFDVALSLLNRYNIGTILKEYDIHPGSSYRLDHIANSISDALQGDIRFYIKCLQPKNSEKQYLLEVNLCFNIYFVLGHCYPYLDRPSVHDCDSRKDVFYSGMPQK